MTVPHSISVATKMPPIAMCSNSVMKGLSKKKKVDNHLELVNDEAIRIKRVAKPGDRVWTQCSYNTWRGAVVLETGIIKSAPNEDLDAMEDQEHYRIIYFGGFENTVLGALAWYAEFAENSTDEDRAECLVHAEEAIKHYKSISRKPRRVSLWGYRDKIVGIKPAQKSKPTAQKSKPTATKPVIAKKSSPFKTGKR
jgi:hypothetical protein